MKWPVSLPPIFSVLVLTAQAGSIADSTKQLAAEDQEFLFHVNLEEDFSLLGSFLSDAYLAYLMTNRDIPPIPVDFNRLFLNLGLDGLTSATWSSERLENGGFVNQCLLRFEDSPSGIFLLTGDRNRPFQTTATLPVDADLAGEFFLNGSGLRELVRILIVDLMGPLGQGLFDNLANQPIVPDGPTYGELVNRFTTRIDFAARLEEPTGTDKPGLEQFLQSKAALRIYNTGDLLRVFAPLLEYYGFKPAVAGNLDSLVMTVPSLQENTPISIYLRKIPESNDLLLSLSEDSAPWFLSSTEHMEDSSEIRATVAGLPGSGLSFWYTSDRFSRLQISQIDTHLPNNENAAPLMEVLKKFLMRFAGAQAGVSYLDGKAYRVKAYQPTSYKTGLAITAVTVPVSLAVSLAPILEKQKAAATPEEEGPQEEALPPD